VLDLGDRVRPDMSARRLEDPTRSAWNFRYRANIEKSSGIVVIRNPDGIFVRWDKESHWKGEIQGPYHDWHFLRLSNGLETMLKESFGE
jgi:hypothetical protein